MEEFVHMTTRQAIADSLVGQVARLETAQTRTNSLFAIYDELPHEQGEDLLRAVVVWLHGALEEALRLYVASALVTGDKRLLDRVPLVGGNALRAEKFFLGSLAELRDFTVLQVIQDSVEAYSRRLTFNDFGDVAGALELLELTDERREALKSPMFVRRLEELFQRRHKIVHEGDLLPGHQPGLRALSKDTVVVWQAAVMAFIGILIATVEATRSEIALGPEWTEEAKRLDAVAEADIVDVVEEDDVDRCEAG